MDDLVACIIIIALTTGIYTFGFIEGNKRSDRAWEEIKKGKIECEEKLPRDEHCYMTWSNK